MEVCRVECKWTNIECDTKLVEMISVINKKNDYKMPLNIALGSKGWQKNK